MHMSSAIFVGDRRDISDDVGTPTGTYCPHCYCVATILITKDEYPLEWEEWQTAVTQFYLYRKFPDDHDCERFK